MLENLVDILCVNFKPNRKGTPFRINTDDDEEEYLGEEIKRNEPKKWGRAGFTMFQT
jgi:hypothetical protein